MKVVLDTNVLISATFWEGDSDDDKFLECAVEGNANFIVSQDSHLLKLKEFRGIRILTPSAFLTHQALQQP